MDVAEDFPESQAPLDPLKEGLQVGPAAIFPVFLGQSQELEAVQGGSQEDIGEGEGTATEPQLTFLSWRGRERRWEWMESASTHQLTSLPPASAFTPQHRPEVTHSHTALMTFALCLYYLYYYFLFEPTDFLSANTCI